MHSERNGEAATSPNRAILNRHVETPDFIPATAVRQAPLQQIAASIKVGGTL
jgi:hypothetical protein